MSSIDTEIEEGLSEPLYPTDTGKLTLSQRQLLVYLLKGPYLLRSDRPNLWNTLIMSRAVIESSLSDVFLTLVMNEDMGVAFCRQADHRRCRRSYRPRAQQFRLYDSTAGKRN